MKFEELMLVELNNTHIEKIISPLFQRMVDGGRASGATRNAKLEKITDDLSKSDKLKNFDSPNGIRALNGWIQTSLLAMKYVSKRRVARQMGYVKPVNIATYRAGLPVESGERRAADKSVYKSMLLAWKRRGYQNPQDDIKKTSVARMGRGLNVETPREIQPVYDEKTTVDINQLLAMRFLAAFPDLRTPQDDFKPGMNLEDSLPGSVQSVGEDLYRLLKAYKESSPDEIIEMILGVVSYRLFQIPFRVQIALDELKKGFIPTDLEGFTHKNPHKIYCDFTAKEGASQNLSKNSVLMDIEKMHGLLKNRVLVNVIETCVGGTTHKQTLTPLSLSERMVERFNLLSDTSMHVAARFIVDEIRTNLINELGDESEEVQYLDNLVKRYENPIIQLSNIVYDAKVQTVTPSQLKWMWSIGGLQNEKERLPYALLDGSVKHKQTWRYKPTDSLISTLIAICMVEENSDGNVVIRSQMPLGDLLDELEYRFGMLINRAPESFDTPENRIAVDENFHSFMRRLKNLGCFDGLSDDSHSQPVFNPKVGNRG